jgi:hypothetical protein
MAQNRPDRRARRSNAPHGAAKSGSATARQNAILAAMGTLHELAQSGDLRGRSSPDDHPGRVVPLRPRPGLGRRPSQAGLPAEPAIEDVGKYERERRDDDYRHRMLMNALGFFACAVLIAAGLWIANAIAELRSHQDCVFSGRRDCAHIDVPSRIR